MNGWRPAWTLDALRRKNLEGKKNFVEELRRQKTPQALSLLLEILCDESWYLRELAIGALAEMGATAVPPLRRLLATGLWYTRAASRARSAGWGMAPPPGPSWRLSPTRTWPCTMPRSVTCGRWRPPERGGHPSARHWPPFRRSSGPPASKS